jgi:hypothetical protein
MLDELMGKERDVPLDRRSNKVIKFTDSMVCKHALSGLCPNTLFTNTRSDLGESSRLAARCVARVWYNISAGAASVANCSSSTCPRRTVRL